MSRLLIRQADIRDPQSIAQHKIALARESEGKRLDAATAARGARAVLDDPSKGLYLVAERDGVLVGQLMITFECSDWRNAGFWWIQSAYVDPGAQRGDVFRALYVESAKTAAHEAYEALGMRRAHYDIYEISL